MAHESLDAGLGSCCLAPRRTTSWPGHAKIIPGAPEASARGLVLALSRLPLVLPQSSPVLAGLRAPCGRAALSRKRGLTSRRPADWQPGGICVGRDAGSPVMTDYEIPFAFTGHGKEGAGGHHRRGCRRQGGADENLPSRFFCGSSDESVVETAGRECLLLDYLKTLKMP